MSTFCHSHQSLAQFQGAAKRHLVPNGCISIACDVSNECLKPLDIAADTTLCDSLDQSRQREPLHAAVLVLRIMPQLCAIREEAFWPGYVSSLNTLWTFRVFRRFFILNVQAWHAVTPLILVAALRHSIASQQIPSRDHKREGMLIALSHSF
jgi:hypothetical protein